MARAEVSDPELDNDGCCSWRAGGGRLELEICGARVARDTVRPPHHSHLRLKRAEQPAVHEEVPRDGVACTNGREVHAPDRYEVEVDLCRPEEVSQPRRVEHVIP